MAHDPNEKAERDLDDLFAAARIADVAPSDQFLDRLYRDAEAFAPETPVPSTPRRTWFSFPNPFLVASGLAGATACGVVIGFFGTETLNQLIVEDTGSFLVAENAAINMISDWSE